MTIRRINHTGRQKIHRDDVRVSVLNKGPRHSEFEAALSLAEYRLPENAAVFVEAYALSTYQRFDFGRVGDFRPPSNLILSEFDTTEGIKFRVKVVEQAEGRKHILAEADQITPLGGGSDESGQSPLLPVRPSGELDEAVYRLDMSDSPILLVNARVGDWRSIITAPGFISLVYPAILRQILTQILLVERHDDLEDMEDWRSQWLSFTRTLPHMTDLPDLAMIDEAIDWIDAAIESFTKQHRMLNAFTNAWLGA
ncbi:MAG: hypothetical protein WD049_03470 [Candidatus Paceibacterota bacterium]